MLMNKHLLPVLVLTILLGIAPSALAQVLVVSSNSKMFRIGDEIQGTASILLADQEQLRVVNKATGETQLLVGPYDGPLSQYKAPCTSEGQSSLDCRTLKRSKPVGGSRGPLRNASPGGKLTDPN
jgi:hypothetical protein